MVEHIKQIINEAEHIVVLQADNPDGDSLGSALALEQILSRAGKSVYLYCGVEIPTYLRYLEGWSRVNSELPTSFDAGIIVDASTLTLFEKLVDSGQKGRLANKPCIVLDHHQTTDNSIDFADVTVNRPELSSTGELIFNLALELSWQIDKDSGMYIMTSVLGDTQGLSNNLTGANTYRLMAELTELGVDRAGLEEARREASKMPAQIYKFKGELIERTEYYDENRLAMVTLSQEDINTYSPLYNPGPLIQGDMLNTTGVLTGIVFKVYDDGKITAMIRCNQRANIASIIAEHFGGGGHKFAAGFKVTDGRSFADIKAECIRKVLELHAALGDHAG